MSLWSFEKSWRFYRRKIEISIEERKIVKVIKKFSKYFLSLSFSVFKRINLFKQIQKVAKLELIMKHSFIWMTKTVKIASNTPPVFLLPSKKHLLRFLKHLQTFLFLSSKPDFNFSSSTFVIPPQSAWELFARRFYLTGSFTEEENLSSQISTTSSPTKNFS